MLPAMSPRPVCSKIGLTSRNVEAGFYSRRLGNSQVAQRIPVLTAQALASVRNRLFGIGVSLIMSMPPSLSRRAFLAASAGVLAHAALASSGFQDENLKASVSGAAFRASGSTAKIRTRSLRKNVT